MSLFDLTGKVAVVTGASKGIGRSIAEQLAVQGAKVVVSSRDLAACEVVAAQIRDAGGEAIALACNVNHKEQLSALVDGAMAEWGRIDILVCNAAINPFAGPSAEVPDEIFAKVMTTNVQRNAQLCNLVIPQMAERGDGVILVISSLGGMQGSATLMPYTLSKAADMQLVRNIATEWGHKNIRANCIAPGLIRTDFSKAIWDSPDANSVVQALKSNPLPRIGEPEDVAGIAVALASAAGNYITGQTIAVDGGKLIGRVTA